MRKVLTVFVVGSLALVLASCGSTSRRSFVRIVNASPDAGTIDVTLNGSKFLSGLAYGSGSNYFTVAPGTNLDFKIDRSSVTTGSFDTKITLVDKAYYTISAVGLVGSSTFSILQTVDDHSAPGSGDVKIRVLQLDPNFHVTASDSGPVDVYITAPALPLNGTTTTFSDLTFGSPGNYASVKVPTDGNQEIRVAAAGDPDPNGSNLKGWDSQTLALTAGQVRTYILLENTTGTPFPEQSLLLKDVN